MKTGNVKQVVNYEQLVSMTTALGAGYKPAKSSITLPALNALLAKAHQSLQHLNAAENQYTKAVSTRAAAFDGLKKTASRVVFALASSDVPAEIVDDASMIVSRLRYRHTARSSAPDNTGALTANADPPVAGRISYQDFGNKAMLFHKLVQLVESEPGYSTNEADLTVDQLKAYSGSLNACNVAVAEALATLRMSRMNRDAILYGKGIYTTAVTVKTYVKSAFGQRSPEFSSIGGLRFRPGK